MASFWKNKPVRVNFIEKNMEPKNILDSDTLLHFINYELEKFPIKLKYTKHFSEEMNDNEKFEVLNFINTHYNNYEDEYKISYSYDLFNMFFKDAVLIKCYLDFDNIIDTSILSYLPNKFDSQVGMVIGKRKNLSVGSKIISCMEGNFLCVIKQFRDLHISSLIINILTKESIELYDINCSYYTIGKMIKSPSFCNKKINYIPINIEQLYNLKFLSNDYTIEEYKETYNVVNTNELSNTHLLYVNGGKLIWDADTKTDIDIDINVDLVLDSYINSIFDMIKTYSKKHYYVFDNMTIHDFKSLFINKSFHNFIFVDKSDYTIRDYICFFRLDYIKNTDTDINNNVKDPEIYIQDGFCKLLKNGFLYLIINDNLKNIKRVLKFCYLHKIIDMIITNKIFENVSIIQTDDTLNYYMYNIELSYINDKYNGLVTI